MEYSIDTREAWVTGQHMNAWACRVRILKIALKPTHWLNADALMLSSFSQSAEIMPKSSHRKKWNAKERRPGDSVMPDPRDTDLVIPVMGSSGVGKSTFINSVIALAQVRQGSASVGHDLRSRTTNVEHFTVPLPRDPSRRLVFVDTPGFDDTYVEDSEILRRIAVWLAKSYSDNMKLAGVVYLHEISQPRMMGTPLKNLEMFRHLCGDKAVQNVILATTKWDEVTEDVGSRREKQLVEKYWKHMLDLGSGMCRFLRTPESAWEIVNLILDRVQHSTVDSLQIQVELVDLRKIIPETEAGRTLRCTLEELLVSEKKVAEQLRRDGGTKKDSRLWETFSEHQAKIQSTLNQIQELKIPLSRRITSFLSNRP
ncbi:hypothetical protein Hypma_015573 [Hypsizygus marmoreus]|uniref:Septin-type G domain-containing protein n=1 Tax=Hypsizygus marmoreus TaxID=39966 RepID=A0A369K6E8_HYPMA|nr:hypothetical protein Hypma_015573 [Hypsizygus marmoreus]